nr:MAG TPA: Protein of unknown function (DUF2554) [Caudoviricetes sp.]
MGTPRSGTWVALLCCALFSDKVPWCSCVDLSFRSDGKDNL